MTRNPLVQVGGDLCDPPLIVTHPIAGALRSGPGYRQGDGTSQHGRVGGGGEGREVEGQAPHYRTPADSARSPCGDELPQVVIGKVLYIHRSSRPRMSTASSRRRWWLHRWKARRASTRSRGVEPGPYGPCSTGSSDGGCDTG